MTDKWQRRCRVASRAVTYLAIVIYLLMLYGEVSSIESEMDAIQSDVSSIQSDVSSIESEIPLRCSAE